MNTTLLNVTRLNVTELNVTRLNSEGLAGMGKKGGGMEAAIRRSMVLWYDIARQGCTNESMAANPVLKDLSGNGHDATCYNFAWTEESGISSVNYPNALVFDGVDDKTSNMTIPENKGTFICKIKQLEKDSFSIFSTENDFVYSFAIRGGNILCWPDVTSTSVLLNLKEEDIAVVRYDNENIPRVRLNTLDKYTDTLDNENYRVDPKIYRFGYSLSFALYSLLLFDRTLTDEEIDWVKENLIEGKTITM